MFRLLAVCVTAIYCVLILFGDESRRPDVARQVQDDVTGFSLASFKLPETTAPQLALTSGITETEAVQMALEAGRAHRTERAPSKLRGMTAGTQPLEAATQMASESSPDLWYVTGTRVNLRSGPGTGNAVVGQMALGDAAEVLDNRDGWYQVRATNGDTAGWIFGKFLAETQPG